MTTKKTPSAVVFPFISEKFMETWELWKNYKKETFGFFYKGVFSEQMTLKKLTELSGGEEDKAIGIIEQSIMQQWQGLFPLHIPRYNENGERKTKKSGTTSTESGTLRERVQAEFNRRNGVGQQSGNSGNS